MNKFAQAWRQTLYLCRSMFFPAVLFGLALLFFYGNDDFSRPHLLFLHISFYGFALLTLGILLYFDQRRPFFYTLSLIISYILINILKTKYGIIPTEINFLQSLMIFLPFNLLLFCFLPEHKLLSEHSLFLFLFILLEYTLAEKFPTILTITNGDTETSVPDTLSLILFVSLIISTFIRAVLSGTNLDYALFFSNINILAGTYYYASPTALALFFSVSAFTLLLAVSTHIYYNTYKDALTGLMSRKAYVVQSAKFPLKYSIGIISIDDYDKLAYMVGKRQRNALVKMIAQKLAEAEPEEDIYRYSEEEFVIIFKNEIKKEGYKRMENLRRLIASASFCVPNNKKTVKLTVSGCISEKKRSDANSVEVLVRAHKVLQKTLSFNHNITSQA